MNTSICVGCGETIPKGRLICLRCEQKEIRLGMILQTNNATLEEVEDAYQWLYASIDEVIDMC